MAVTLMPLNMAVLIPKSLVGLRGRSIQTSCLCVLGSTTEPVTYAPLRNLFYLQWVDFKASSLHTDLVHKIAVYSSEKMDELIKLTKPKGSMNGLPMRWHPMMMVPSQELTTTPNPVGVQEWMDNIMLVIDEAVMPMMDAVVWVATEMTERNGSSVIEDMFSKVEEQKKKLHFCFGSKLYPDAVRMSPILPATKYGGGSVSQGVAIEDCHGGSSCGLPGFAMDVDGVASQDGAATSVGAGGCLQGLITEFGAGFGAEHPDEGGDDACAEHPDEGAEHPDRPGKHS